MHTRTALKHISHFTFVIAIESYIRSFFVLLTANEWSSVILHVYILFKRSQTCSNDHLYKMITRLRRPMVSSPKQISVQSILYKMTTYLTRLATIFWSLKWGKTCLKQPLQNYIPRRNGKQT